MIRIIFRYPAKLVSVDAPVFRSLTTPFGEVFVSDGKSYYVSQDTGKLRYTLADDGHQYFWLIAPETLVPLTQSWDDETFIESITQMGDGFQQYLDQFLIDINDPPDYEKRQADKRRLRKLESDAIDSKIAERAAKSQRDAEVEHESAVLAFKRGESISWRHFEKMCADFGVILHIRTIGSCRQNVSKVSQSGVSIARGARPQALWQAIRQISALILDKAA